MLSYRIPFSLVAALLFACAAFSQTGNSVSPEAFQQQIIRKDIQLLDVRTAGEYQSGHITHALQADWNNRAQFTDRIQSVDKTRPVYIYCLSGGRSAAAATWMRQNGYDSVIELKGGINAWKNADKPVEGVAPVSAISLESYKAGIGSTGWTLVDFGAEWCPPCRKMEPVIGHLQQERGNTLHLLKIDGGTQTALMKELQVEGIPTFILYHDGKEMWRKQGIVALDEFNSQLNRFQ